ncbi:glucose uptake protein [Enterococcus faecium]|nr:glucose uptake protein [Enterococcus faecium]
MLVLTSSLFWIVFFLFIGIIIIWWVKWTRIKYITLCISLPTLYFLIKILNLYHWESSAIFEKELIHLGLLILLYNFIKQRHI